MDKFDIAHGYDDSLESALENITAVMFSRADSRLSSYP